MEITTIRSFVEFQDKVRTRTDRLLAVVPPDRLDFAYLPGKFTIGDQIRHIAAIECGVNTPPMFGLTAEEVRNASTP